MARSLTIASSLVAELERPYPAIILLSFNGLALIAALFLPTYNDEVAYDAKLQQMADEAIEAGKELEQR